MNGAPAESGRRIVVTGLSGSGKSTFSHALAAKSGLPLIHLDLQFWNPGWVEPSEAEWREKQRRLLAGDAWIADGNYRETLDLRLERADTVVVLATPWWRCAGRAFLRGFRMPDRLPEGCAYSAWQRLRDEWRLIPAIWRVRRSELESELAIIAQHGHHATRHVLTSRRAASEFLDDSAPTVALRRLAVLADSRGVRRRALRRLDRGEPAARSRPITVGWRSIHRCRSVPSRLGDQRSRSGGHR